MFNTCLKWLLTICVSYFKNFLLGGQERWLNGQKHLPPKCGDHLQFQCSGARDGEWASQISKSGVQVGDPASLSEVKHGWRTQWMMNSLSISRFGVNAARKRTTTQGLTHTISQNLGFFPPLSLSVLGLYKSALCVHASWICGANQVQMHNNVVANSCTGTEWAQVAFLPVSKSAVQLFRNVLIVLASLCRWFKVHRRGGSVQGKRPFCKRANLSSYPSTYIKPCECHWTAEKGAHWPANLVHQ